MPRLAGRFTVQKKSKRPGKFIFTINESSGLPEEVCLQWQRRAFSCLPPELAHFREPTSKTVARNAVGAFIDFLKKEVTKGTVYRFSDPLTIGEWLIRFTSLDNNPRAERLISEGTPYSPGTVEDLYFNYYNRYIAGDPILDADINTIDIPSCRAWLARIGMKKCKKGRVI